MQTKKQKASILVYSLILLSVMLLISTSIAMIAVVERKSAGTTQRTTQAFQNADSGIEMYLSLYNSVTSANLATTPIGDNTYLNTAFNCNDSSGVAVLAGHLNGDARKDIEIRLLNSSNIELQDCAANNLSEVAAIKSVGKYDDTRRVVQVGIANAAGTLSCTSKNSALPAVLNATVDVDCDSGDTATGAGSLRTAHIGIDIRLTVSTPTGIRCVNTTGVAGGTCWVVCCKV